MRQMVELQANLAKGEIPDKQESLFFVQAGKI